MANPFDYQKFSNYVGGIIDRKIRAITLSITSSTSYLKFLVTESSENAQTAQTAASSATVVWNGFTSTYLGVLGNDPQLSSIGLPINANGIYIRSSDSQLRKVISIINGVVTWGPVYTLADETSTINAARGKFLYLLQDASQDVQGLVNFQKAISVIGVTDWNSYQATPAIDVKTRVDTETTRATAAESTLTTNLNNEVTRATAAEVALGVRVTNETTRATAVENTLTTNLNTETTRATAAESTLTTNLNNEVTRATAAEVALGTRVTNEINRATGVENTLTTNLANEVTRATAAEVALGVRITDETTRATAAESALNTAIGNETARAISVEGPLAAFIASFTSGTSGSGRWRKFPDGEGGIIIEQWGVNTSGDNQWSGDINFPIPFLQGVQFMSSTSTTLNSAATNSSSQNIRVSPTNPLTAFQLGSDDVATECWWLARGK